MKIKLFMVAFTATAVVFGVSCKKDPEKSSECKILKFTVNGVDYQPNEAAKTFTHTYKKISPSVWENMPSGKVAPAITISDKASIDPAASVEQEFVDKTVTYTVTAEDGKTKAVYKVTATKGI